MCKIYSYCEEIITSQIKFLNEQTNEYLYYNLTIEVIEPNISEIITIESVIYESLKRLITIENPLYSLNQTIHFASGDL